MNKPHSPSCDRNKEPILEALKKIITNSNKSLLEIGAGTGQHAVHMAPHFEHLHWHVADVAANLEGIKAWLAEAKDNNVKNIHGPIEFEIGKSDFPKTPFDIVFSANTLHIMSWKNNKSLFKTLGTRLREGSQAVLYGPFNYNGEFTSESNAKFDVWLKERDPQSGIRSFEDVKRSMEKNGFSFTEDIEMPANNRILVFTKLSKK